MRRGWTRANLYGVSGSEKPRRPRDISEDDFGAASAQPSGTVLRDVEDAEPGPTVAAFFDFDRTLIAGFSAIAFLAGWVLSGRMGPRGLARTLLATARFRAGRIGFSALVAPVRPTWKDRYPLIPMERYITWRRDDGLPFDPWLRVHERLGATLVEVCDASMVIRGTAAEWEEWTGLVFPDDGDFLVPGGLVPVRFTDGHGVYVEPNVWMRHPVG